MKTPTDPFISDRGIAAIVAFGMVMGVLCFGGGMLFAYHYLR